MELKDFFPITTAHETTYGALKFAPINVDYFINLQDWHAEGFENVQRLDTAASDDVKQKLVAQRTLVAMLHTATYPYVKKDVGTEAWKKTCFALVQTDAELLKWFLEYFYESLPKSKSKSKTRAS